MSATLGQADEVNLSATEILATICRRCGKQFTAADRCPYCHARIPAVQSPNSAAAPALTPVALPDPAGRQTIAAVTRLLVFYILLLATNVFGHWITMALVDANLTKSQLTEEKIGLTLSLEMFDTMIVLAALALIPWPPKLGGSSFARRATGWLFALPILAAVLALNLGYHSLLRSYAQFPHWTNDEVRLPLGWAIGLICIQPAVVEELFFRFLALGTLTRVMGIGGAICVSAVMFGMAHSSVLLSIPILTVVGLGLGIVRVWSGSLLLPMLLHALHNAVVLYLEMKR